MKKITILFSSCLIATAMQAQILHVPADYQTIQAAVDAAGYGDTVLVAPGTYVENVMIEGNEKTITLAGNFLFSADPDDIDNTIIDAGQPADTNRSMGIAIRYQDSTLDSRIIGFTIQNGNGYYQTFGGGIYVWRATPIIEHNHILNCSVHGLQPQGGGIHVGNLLGTERLTVIRENVIKNCTITSTARLLGGGISINNGLTLIEHNQVSLNVLLGTTTGSCEGGGIFMLNPTQGTAISHNTITENTLSLEAFYSWGGGIYLERDEQDTLQAVPLIEGNRVDKNSANRGGGIFCNYLCVKMVNNLVTGNLATTDGGGIKIIGPGNDYELSEITNNTIYGNTVSGNNSGGGVTVGATGNTSFLFLNNIIYGNEAATAKEMLVTSGQINLYNCNIDVSEIQGSWTGNDNFNGDPCFIDDEFQIEETSCCEDKGRASIELIPGAWYYAPLVDRFDTLRPHHLGYDVGSDECDFFEKLPEYPSTGTNIIYTVIRPNPFIDVTTLEYELDRAGQVNIFIFNSQGQQVAVLVNNYQDKGQHIVQWNAEGLPAGFYFYQLAVGSRQSAVGKILKY